MSACITIPDRLYYPPMFGEQLESDPHRSRLDASPGGHALEGGAPLHRRPGKRGETEPVVEDVLQTAGEGAEVPISQLVE